MGFYTWYASAITIPLLNSKDYAFNIACVGGLEALKYRRLEEYNDQ